VLYEPTCEVCGSLIYYGNRAVCEPTGYNGNWVKEVIKDKDDSRDT